MTAAHLHVIDGGLLTTIQDLGRPGHAHHGVPPSGALDRPAHVLANRLVGNPSGAATLEATLQGPSLRLDGGTVRHIALTGAPCGLRVDGRPRALYAPVTVRPGQVIEVGTASIGLRSYLAVGGGILADAELGSRSTDLLSGLGPAPLTAGTALLLGPATDGPVIDGAPTPGHPDEVTLLVVAGPRDDWLTAAAGQGLRRWAWTVTSASNRIGLRLEGPPLRWAEDRELPPEGLVTGAVQVPPGGQPVVFLNDHPTTGGYPVVAVVDDSSLPGAAQARPGTTVRFAGAPPRTAVQTPATG